MTINIEIFAIFDRNFRMERRRSTTIRETLPTGAPSRPLSNAYLGSSFAAAETGPIKKRPDAVGIRTLPCSQQPDAAYSPISSSAALRLSRILPDWSMSMTLTVTI